MNYCPLEDAWGKSYDNKISISQQDNNSLSTDNINKTNIETFENTNNIYKNDNNICNSDQIIEHIKKCSKCSNKLRIYFKSPLIIRLNNIIEENKDFIIIICLIIFILLFLNLINNVIK